jgi:hypothetical protein
MRKGLSLVLVLFLLSSLLTWVRPAYALSAATVTVNPAVGGKVASYSIQFTTGSNAANALPATGYIKITFPSGTKLPTGSINKNYVTVNATNPATDPTVSGSVVKILIPTPLAISTPVTVIFTSSAQIQNPTSPTGMLKLKVETGYMVGTSDTVIEAAVDSNKYFIGYPATITAVPNTDNSVYEVAEYKVEWKTGNEGALIKNSSIITLVFDPSYVLPTWTGLGYIPASYIRVNNTQLSSNATCSAAPLTISFKVPVDIAINTAVTILLTNQVGLQNPAPGDYSIDVSSTTESTATPSNTYTITDAVAFFDLLTPAPAGIQGVIVNPPATSAEASYTIGIQVDIPLTANLSTITFAFPTGTTFPTQMPASAITFDVNGTVTPLAVDPTKNGTLVSITVPVNIIAADKITVTFDKSLKIKNPTTAGLYSIQAMTSAQPFYRPSPRYAIGTAVTNLKVTPSPNTNDEVNVRYDVEFNLGASGALTKNVDTIIIFLKVAAPTAPATINASSVLIGTDYTSVATDVQTPMISDNVPPGYTKFIITPPKDINNSQVVKVSFLPSAGIKNPVAGTYKAYVHTSKEPILVESPFYTISNAVKIISVVVDPPSAGVEAKYTIDIVTALALTKDVDTITVAFPTGTTIPSNITPGNITINGTPLSFTPTYSGQIITMMVPLNIIAGATVTIEFTLAAKIKNPTNAGIYKLQVKTSAQPDYRVSPIYGIGTSVTNVKVTPQPDTKGSDNVIYLVEFKLGAYGALTANTDVIDIFLNIAAPVPPATLVASSVLVGSDSTIVATTVTTPLLGEPGGYKLSVTPPKDIAANQTVKITFLGSAGLKNPVEGNYKGYVRTSKEPIIMESPYYLIKNAVTVTSVTVTPPSTSTEAEYEIVIVTGEKLKKDIDSISIAFPTGTTVPSSITPGTITINTTPLLFSPTISSSVVTMLVPIDIPAGTTVTILFTKSAKVKNPTAAGIYSLQVKTSTQPYYRVSPSYAIGTAVTSVVVTPTPQTKNSTNVQYVIDFKLGQQGALAANTDKIVIILKVTGPVPPTTLPASSVLVNSNYTIQSTIVELVGIAEEPGLTGYYRFTVFPPKDIAASQAVKVTFLPSAGLQNPISGNYKGTVRTSQELILVESDFYQITDAVDITAINVQPPSTGTEAEYTITFTVGTGLLADNGTITVFFPSGTTIPTTIPVTGVTLAVGANPPVSLTVNPTVSSGRVTMTTPVAIPASSVVVLKFLIGAGIKNPTTPGLYKLQLMTSSQPYFRESPSYAIGSSVTNVIVTPMPNNVSEINVEYKVEFKNGKIVLNKNIDQLFVYLPVTTALLSIPPAGILVNNAFTELGSSINPVTIDGNNYLEFGIYTPVNLPAGQAVTVIILASCALVNPATENIYYGYVSTSQENIKIKSQLYNIVDSVGFPGFNPPTDLRSVLPKPNAINLPAQYLIHFRTSVTKPPLTINTGVITIVFPTGTKVPGTMSSGSIYISLSPGFGPLGPDATTCPPSPPANWNIVNQPVQVSGQEVKIVTPIQIPVGSDVYVLFCQSANVQNPPDAGLYTLQVKTSSQPNYGISRSYLIRSTVTKPVVTPVPAVTSQIAEYTVRLKAGSQGALQANTDKIFLAFDGASFTTPIGNIAPSSLKVNGVFMNVYANIGTGPTLPPNVDNPPGWATYRWIEIQTPIDIKESSEITIQILLPAGLTNPIVAGNYKLVAWTNKEPVAIESEIFTIGDAIVNVTIPPSYPNPKTSGSIAEYFLTFTLGASPTSGLSQALMSTITVTFPEGTKLPTTINPADIKIGFGGPCVPTDSAIPPVTIDGQKISFAVPITIPAGSSVCVNFLKGAKIQNPDTPGSYRIMVKTSSQPIDAYSNYYTILSTSSIPKVIASPPAINIENTAYSITFKTGVNGSLTANIGKIVIFFDPSYIGPDYTAGFMANPSNYPGLYTSIPPNSILINDSPVTSITKVKNTAPAGGDLSYIEIITPIDIDKETDVTVKFNNITGIKNPPLVGNYRLAVLTSAEPTPVESVEFSLFSSITIPNVVLSVSDNITPKPKGTSPNSIVQYNITFTTGPSGNLVRDIGTIAIQFPPDTYIPDSFSASSIKIRVGAGIPVTLTQAPVVDVANRRVVLTVPDNIPVSTLVEVIFSELTGIKNPTEPGNYYLYVSTSSEPLEIKSNPYLIEGISSAAVTVDPCLQNSSFVHYTIEFTITKPLAVGNYIYVEFPYGTRLPSVIQGSDVLVNGKPATTGAFPQIVVTQQQVQVKIPDAISALTKVKLEFLADARVTNPDAGNYSLKVRTDIDTIMTPNPPPPPPTNVNGNNDPDDRWIESKGYFICTNLTLKSLDLQPSQATLAKGESKTFTVIAKDDQDREITAGLKYVWSVEGTIGTVSPNNTNQVTFKAGATAGSGKLSVNVSYGGSSMTAFATISVAASLASISISPSTVSLGIGQTQVFTATALDELGNSMNIDFDWSIVGSIGSISPIKGKQTTLTASTQGSGSVKVKAVFGSITKETQASVTVTTAPPPPPPPEGQAFTSVINPNSVRANQGDVTFQISITALKDILNGLVVITVPEGFPLPSRSPGGQGFVDAVATSPASISTPPTVNGKEISITVLKMGKGNTFTVSYSRVSAPSTPGEYIFTIKGKENATSAMTDLDSPPKVLVISIADGSGRATIQPTDGSAGAVGQKFVLTYIADADMSGGAIQFVIPDGWSKPTTSSTVQGYVELVEKSTDIGAPEISDATITIAINKLGVGQKIAILYSNVSIPNVPNTYTFVARSKGLGGSFKNLVLSPTVIVANTRVDSAKVEVTPNMTTVVAEYIISFKTSKSGFLAKDQGSVTLVFPPETDIPNTIKSDLILINNTPVKLPPEVDSIRSTIKIIVPLDLDPNTLIQIKFTLDCGIKNPKTPKDDYKIRIYTSTDTVPSDSTPYKIMVSSLRNVKVTPSPIVPGASAQYRIQLNVGGGGGLNVNQDSITFLFPSDTVLPSSIAANGITVNATPLQTRPMIDIAQRKITILLPVRIENDSEVSVVISQDANVKNPTKDGMYKMKVFTSKEVNPVESAAYQIGQSLLGDVKVSLSTSLVESTNVTYTVSFRTGAFGSMSVGDKITVTFDKRYRLPSIQAYQITVNGVVCTITPEISEGNSIIFNIPIAISAQSTATITISGIKNPSEAGEYSLSLATTAEPNPVMSSPYRIGLVLVTELTINPSEPNGLAGWYTIAPNLILTNIITSAKIFYSWDNGSPQPYTGSSITAPEGVHTITYYSIAEGLDDETKKSTTIKVDTKAPVIRVTRPTESSTVNQPDLVVEGDVDEQNNYIVTVNEKPATVTDKRFTITISLNPGENWIDIVATDEAGNRSITPRIRITYVLPSDIKINVTSPKSLSSILPTLKLVSGGSYQLVAMVKISGSITPNNADEIMVYIMGKMETPIRLPIAADGTFDGNVELPMIAGMNGITLSVKDKISGKEFQSSIAVIAKIVLRLQIANALAFMNDKEYRLDAPPYIKNGRTMLPMRFIGESLGASVGWKPETKTVIYDLDTIHIELTIGSTSATVKKGDKTDKIKLDAPPEIIKGRTFVPLRVISENLGADVKWDAAAKKITVTK